MFFDSHCHFDFAAFDEDREALWRHCQDLGVCSLLVPGVSPPQWEAAARLCRDYRGMIYGAGVHPWWVGDLYAEGFDDAGLRTIMVEELEKPGCKAVGECGLDALCKSPMDLQQQVLEAQLAVAAERDLPVILHCVKAHNELLQALDASGVKRGVVHAFSGSPELAQQYWRRGFYLGIGGTITYERARKTRAAVQQLPLTALLLETDAPDMPLAGRQGERNSPAYLPEVARVLAQLRGESMASIAEVTTANARALFQVDEPVSR